jgi:hypothetical protein
MPTYDQNYQSFSCCFVSNMFFFFFRQRHGYISHLLADNLPLLLQKVGRQEEEGKSYPAALSLFLLLLVHKVRRGANGKVRSC